MLRKKNFLSSLDHALVVLETLGLASKPLGVSDLSRETGYPKTTIHRVLLTLLRRGFIRKEPATDRYQLTLKFFEIGSVAVHQLGVKEVARPYLEKLKDLSGETAHLAVMDDDGAFYIDKIESAQSIRMYSYVGRRAPLHCTAVGKLLLAYRSPEKIGHFLGTDLKEYTEHTIIEKQQLNEELQKVRRQGYALDNEELEKGLFCVAAPVRNYQGQVIAAVSVSGPGVRLTRRKIRELTPLVVEIGGAVSMDLGYSERPRMQTAKNY